MVSGRLVPASVREALLGIPSDIASLERNSEHIVLTGDYDWNPRGRCALAIARWLSCWSCLSRRISRICLIGSRFVAIKALLCFRRT